MHGIYRQGECILIHRGPCRRFLCISARVPRRTPSPCLAAFGFLEKVFKHCWISQRKVGGSAGRPIIELYREIMIGTNVGAMAARDLHHADLWYSDAMSIHPFHWHEAACAPHCVRRKQRHNSCRSCLNRQFFLTFFNPFFRLHQRPGVPVCRSFRKWFPIFRRQGYFCALAGIL